jgi:hypothetical protein
VNSLKQIELSSINKVGLVSVSSCSNTGSIRDCFYCSSRENSLELTELSSINKVGLVSVSSCSNTGSIRDDPHRSSRENHLELIVSSTLFSHQNNFIFTFKERVFCGEG